MSCLADYLPGEIILMMMQHLGKTRQKHVLNAMILTTSAWHRVLKANLHNPCLQRCIKMNMHKLPGLRVAAKPWWQCIHCSSHVGDAAMKAIAEVCPDLRQLNLAGCASITTAGLLEVARGIRGLRALNVVLLYIVVL